LQESKRKPLSDLITALGIPTVGTSAAKLLSCFLLWFLYIVYHLPLIGEPDFVFQEMIREKGLLEYCDGFLLVSLSAMLSSRLICAHVYLSSGEL